MGWLERGSKGEVRRRTKVSELGEFLYKPSIFHARRRCGEASSSTKRQVMDEWNQKEHRLAHDTVLNPSHIIQIHTCRLQTPAFLFYAQLRHRIFRPTEPHLQSSLPPCR